MRAPSLETLNQPGTVYGNPNVGAFSFANDSFALVPPDVPTKVEEVFAENLHVEVHRATVAGSVLLGILIAGNNHGLLLPNSATDEEVEALQRLGDVNVERLQTKLTALGNLILANDHGALVYTSFDEKTLRRVESVLQVEARKGSISGSALVGSNGVATNLGVLVNPLAKERDLALLREVLKVQADVGTVNRGTPYVRTGMTANSKGAVVGDETTGPELARIIETLQI